MTDMIVKAQDKVSYGEMQEAIALLPRACAELFPKGKPDIMKVVQYMGAAVTASAPHLFLCVLAAEDKVCGFLVGLSELDVFSSLKYARVIFSWISPEQRNAQAWGFMAESFEIWAKKTGATEIQGTFPVDVPSLLEEAARQRGYERKGVVVVKKVS